MPTKLAKILSRNRSSYSKEKEAQAEADAVRKVTNGASSSPPPSYTQQPPDYDAENILDPPDVTAGFSNLNLSDLNSDVPQVGQCIAHLKLLECFYRLRQKVGSSDGLYGINDQVVHDQGLSENQNGELLAKLAEKRWAIYVTRAAERFEAWSGAMNSTANMIQWSELANLGRSGRLCDPSNSRSSFNIDQTNMPPADVLMVWHAYMLNPRAYLEDCIRLDRMSMWHAGFPWQAVVDSINSETFAFDVSGETLEAFRTLTGLPWNNTDDTSAKRVECPRCTATNELQYTTCPKDIARIGICGDTEKVSKAIDEVLSSGTGFCDVDFVALCSACEGEISHEKLKVHKFRSDVRNLLDCDVPMAGTILGVDGIPVIFEKQKDYQWLECCKVPNNILSAGLGQEILDQPATKMSMSNIRDDVEKKLKDKAFLSRIPNTYGGHMGRPQKIGIRKMMSRYWENHSRFALDLVGAVIRQGTFIEKMHNIDWLHSPALPSTMKRLLVKYQRFVSLMVDKKNMAVPTLDVDLAWHTHQLLPYMYMKYTVSVTRQFIDHDDKIPETRLNDAFAWTSKTYQKRYNEPYSECTCWYCEAIRESHTSAASRMFNTSSAQVSDQLHDADQDPRISVHISAHNAVRPADKDYEKSAVLKAEMLEKQYQSACNRARKKGRKEPKRDDYYYSDAWGYPVYIPAYSPYMYGYYGMYTPMYYPVTPGCMAVTAGAYGNCCSGTCGGGAAAGACGGWAGGGGCTGGGGACGGGGGGCGGGGGGGGGCGGGGS